MNGKAKAIRSRYEGKGESRAGGDVMAENGKENGVGKNVNEADE
jgi:hypothetical protein